MTILCAVPGILLLMFAFLPRGQAGRYGTTVSRLVTGLTAINLSVAIASLIHVITSGESWVSAASIGAGSVFSLSVWLNGTSALMLTLVAFITWVVSRFSVRYLDGEAAYGNYFRWLAVTTGAISLTIVAGNLLLMLLFLLLTSLGLHELLTHYRDRPAARSAAALKFALSRIGDACLLTAAVALYREFGTLDLPLLFEAVNGQTAAESSVAVMTGGWMLVLCAFFKSAQIPFHTWLPETMEAPTPVSALMHAGIVNVGGYLLIRTAPVVTQATAAMNAAIVVGGLTALVGALVMLSQTSVKRSLAWSTIAQMGFMILQCGLGAFSAAMLHLIAHSLYKAWAFLASGEVLLQPRKTPVSIHSGRLWFRSMASTGLITVAMAGLFLGLAFLLGLSPDSKPGGYLLGLILCLGLARSMAGLPSVSKGLAVTLTMSATLLLTGYLVAFGLVDTLVASSGLTSPTRPSAGMLMSVAATMWLLLLLVELAIASARDSRWLRSLYVHSSNGFYVDVFWKNVSRALTS